MQKLALVAGIATLVGLAQPAWADTVLTFDNIPDGSIVTAQYTGVTITGASVLTENTSLNPAFPPVSDPKVVYDYLNGTITLDFTTAVDSIGAYVTGNAPIELLAYDGATQIGTTSTPGANYIGSTTGYSPNIFLSLAGATITQAVFTNNEGIGDTFTLDNVTIGGTIITNAVPEPESWALFIAGFGLVGAAVRNRKKIAVTYA